jgi:hypothetical protein
MYFLYKNEYRLLKPVEITVRRGLNSEGVGGRGRGGRGEK